MTMAGTDGVAQAGIVVRFDKSGAKGILVLNIRALLYASLLFTAASSCRAETLQQQMLYYLTQPSAMACASHLISKEAGAEKKNAQEGVLSVALYRAVIQKKPLCAVIKAKGQYSWMRKGYNFNKRTEHFSEQVVLDFLFKLVHNKPVLVATHHHDTSVANPWPSMRFVGQRGKIKYYLEKGL